MRTYIDFVSSRRGILVLGVLFIVSLVAMTNIPPTAPGTFSLISGLVFLVILCNLYFCPAIVARKRRHRNMKALLVLNIFLGWTLLGWVGCLVWALLEQEGKES